MTFSVFVELLQLSDPVDLQVEQTDGSVLVGGHGSHCLLAGPVQVAPELGPLQEVSPGYHLLEGLPAGEVVSHALLFPGAGAARGVGHGEPATSTITTLSSPPPTSIHHYHSVSAKMERNL